MLTFIKRTLQAILLLGLALPSTAQKDVMYDQYMEAPMAINPAYTGIQEHFNLNILLRRRWFSIPGAPVTPTLYTDGTIANGHVGLGFMALNDQMSPFSTTGFYGSTSYIFHTDTGWKISVGAQGGINILPVYGQGYTGRKKLASFGLGLWVQNDRFYAGISKPELLDEDFGTGGSRWDYQVPLYLTTGGKIALNNDLVLSPNLTAIVGSRVKNEVHMGMKLWYMKLIGIGAYYRMGEINRFHIVSEVQVGKNVRVGYAYDSRTVESKYNIVGIGLSGMHELIFRFVPNPVSFNYY